MMNLRVITGGKYFNAMNSSERPRQPPVVTMKEFLRMNPGYKVKGMDSERLEDQPHKGVVLEFRKKGQGAN